MSIQVFFFFFFFHGGLGFDRFLRGIRPLNCPLAVLCSTPPPSITFAEHQLRLPGQTVDSGFYFAVPENYVQF